MRQETVREITNPNPDKRETETLINCRMWTSLPQTAHSSQGESQLYIFENNEVVITMIVKDRSVTMRHVSRTHRVVLDRLSDRINLDPKIQIKYVDTKNQLADMLTEENYTRDEWNHLLRLVNMMKFLKSSCSHLSKFLLDPIRMQCAMSKRGQENNLKEGSAVAKPKPLNLNLSSMRKIPSREVRDPNSPVNQILDQSGQPAAGNIPSQGRGPSSRKAEAGIPQYADLGFRVLGQKSSKRRKGESCRCTTSGDPTTQSQPIKFGEYFCRHRLSQRFMGPDYTEIWEVLQEHELRRASEFVRHHPEVGTQTRRDSECDNDWMCISFMDEILAGSRSGNEAVKGKGTSLFRFSLMLGKMTDPGDANRR